MAVVVEQTVPFSTPSLDLQNTNRWNGLLPLVQRGVKQVQTAKGQQILINQSIIDSKSCNTVAVTTPGNFSGKLLDGSKVAAIVSEEPGKEGLTARGIKHALQKFGATEHQALVVVRSGKSRNLKASVEDNSIDVEVNGELEYDHLLFLLANRSKGSGRTIEDADGLVKDFFKNELTAYSTFQTDKVEGKPAISGAGGDSAAFESVKATVEKQLKGLFETQKDQSGKVTYSIHYSDINGLSRLENYIIAKEIAEYCRMYYEPNLRSPVTDQQTPDSKELPFKLSHSTILNHSQPGRGFAISLYPAPSSELPSQEKPQADTTAAGSNGTALSKTLSPSTAQIKFDDAEVRKRIHAGCNAVIKEEPTITEYDTIVGDGDCGYTLRDGAKQVLAFIDGKDLTRLPETVADLVHDLEVNMGGTSGALYCIFLTALAASLASEASVPKALQAALEQLCKYTRARLGDRTMMDALIPFIDTLNSTGDAEQAIAKAKEGVDGTKKMEAKLGRSTYLDESATHGVPDPGAYGLLILLQGMARA